MSEPATSSASAVTVECPATSANLGPGFDALGVALGLANTFVVRERAAGLSVTARALGPFDVRGITRGDPAADRVVLAHQAARAALGLPPAAGLQVEVAVAIPPGRGLGSSATATVAGLLSADALSAARGGPRLSQDALVDLAARLEGHPDNSTPCLLGGLCVMARRQGGGVAAARVTPRDPPTFVAAIPTRLEKSTDAMRGLLPAQVAFRDAVDTLGHATLLVAALLEGRADLLEHALHDRLHQPYRGPTIPGFDAVRAAARDAGAYGVVISGSGPTLLALAPPERAEAVGEAMVSAFEAHGVLAFDRVLPIDRAGARVVD